MAFNFKDAAIQATTLSELMDNRDKLSIDDVISKHPDGVTIAAFDMIDSGDGSEPYAVLVSAEDPKAFFFGGSVMSKICKQWAGAFGGDCKTASAELQAQGGVKVQFSHGKTKKGNSLTLVKVL